MRTKYEWTLWVVAVSAALHATEEYFTGWQAWAVETLGIVMPTSLFAAMNAVLVVAALMLARGGWSRPTLSLVIPVATLVNGIAFHILPTIVQMRAAPGIYSALFLYLPFSSWAIVGARRDGVAKRDIGVACVAGTIMAFGIVLAARSISP